MRARNPTSFARGGDGRAPTVAALAGAPEPRAEGGECFQNVFERVAAGRPDGIAVESEHDALRYGDLDASADAVAGTIAAAGAGPDDVVAVYGELGPDVIAWMLGALKAGAAFFPIDPRDPPKRVRAAVEDVRPRLVIAGAHDHDAAASLGVETRVIVAGAPILAPVRPRTSDRALAYVLLTSGSTGRPKAVGVEHRSLVSYVRWSARAYRVGGAVPPLPTVTRRTFDASLLQTLAPLARGDSVWVLPRSTTEDPAGLLDALRSRPGCGLHCVPALWEELLDLLESGGNADPPRLSLLLLGGERVPASLFERTRRHLPEAVLGNVYGPTETTIQVTAALAATGTPRGVGQAADSARISVRADDLDVVAWGETAEVYVSGTSVARGYLGRPDLTAERFLPDPDGFGERMYRTGDLGSWLDEDCLEIHGRVDEQLKVRGFRIEPGEIEAALREDDDVEAVGAATIGDGSAARIRVAVVPARPGVDVEKIRRRLSPRLPDYMVPSEIVLTDALPRTLSGKLDRRTIAALPSPSGAPPAAHRDRRPLEGVIARIWTQALDIDDVAPDDDFFVLGGHSLLATRVVARTRKAVGVAVPLRTLFENPTLERFSAAVSQLLSANPAVPIKPTATLGLHPLSLQQLELYATERLLAGTPLGNTLLPMRVRGRLDAGALWDALADLVDRHAALRTSFFDGDGGEPVQHVRPPGEVRVARTADDLRGLLPDERRAAALSAARRTYLAPFDLARPPLLRARLLRLDDDEAVLVLSVHHIVCDGISLRSLTAELADAYERRVASIAPSPPPELDYPDFAVWQRARLEAGDFEPLVSFWLTELAGDLEPLELWGERTFAFRTTARAVDADGRQALERLARESGATEFVLLCAALAIALHARAGIRDVRIGTLAAAREPSDVEPIVGLFATTIPVRFALDPEATIAELVDAVRAAAFRAYAHQALPFEVVARRLEIERGVSASDVLPVALVVDPPRKALERAGTTFDVLDVASESQVAAVAPSAAPLTFIVSHIDGGLRLLLEHDEGAVDADDADALLEAFGDAVELLASGERGTTAELLDQLAGPPRRPLLSEG